MLLFGNFDINFLVAAGMVLLFGMGIHEYAHALVADWWGDPTPRQMGRLTPNPIVHINWFGWLMFLVIGFGILGSVPVNTSKMRDPRWGSFWTSAAGPISNLLQAAVFALVLRLFSDPFVGTSLAFTSQSIGSFGTPLADFFALFLTVGVFFNVLLFVFNLLPLFPIDGWHMVLAFLPGRGLNRDDIPGFIRQNIPPLARFMAEPAYTWQSWAQATQYVFFGLLLISFAIPQLNVLGFFISQPTFNVFRILLGL